MGQHILSAGFDNLVCHWYVSCFVFLETRVNVVNLNCDLKIIGI
jgi:hypothetical protein